MRCSEIEMATEGLAFASPFAFRITLSFALLTIAALVHAGPFDYVNLRQFNKNLALTPKHINHTFSLSEGGLDTPLKESSRAEPRNLPNRERSEKRDENRPDVMANEESEWQKQMEELSRKEREKWKKYRGEKSESFATPTANLEEEKTLIKNSDNKVANGMIRKQAINNMSLHKGLRSPELDNDSASQSVEDRDRDRDQSKKSREIFGDKKFGEHLDEGQDFSKVSEIRLRKLKEDLGLLGSGENRGVEENPGDVETNAPEIPNKFPELMKFSELGKRVENRSEGIVENGRWGLSEGFERPPDVKEETESAGKFGEETDKFIADKTTESKKYNSNSNGIRETEKIEGPEKFGKDLSVGKDIAGVKESFEKHSDRLKSDEEKKDAIPESENENRVNEEPKISDGVPEFSRRTLGTFDTFDTFDTPGLHKPEPIKSEKLQEPESSSGIRKLIRIIISPCTSVQNGGMELSIDQLIPERNEGSSIVTERQPIVIGLSTTV